MVNRIVETPFKESVWNVKGKNLYRMWPYLEWNTDGSWAKMLKDENEFCYEMYKWMDCIVINWILNTFGTLTVQKEMGYQGTDSS